MNPGTVLSPYLRIFFEKIGPGINVTVKILSCLVPVMVATEDRQKTEICNWVEIKKSAGCCHNDYCVFDEYDNNNNVIYLNKNGITAKRHCR